MNNEKNEMKKGGKRKGSGRKPDPSKQINIRFKIADYNRLVVIYGDKLTDSLRQLILSELSNLEKTKNHDIFIRESKDKVPAACD